MANKVWGWRHLASFTRATGWKRLAAVSLVQGANLLEDAKKLDEAGKFFDEAARCLQEKEASRADSAQSEKPHEAKEEGLPRVAPAFFRVTRKNPIALYKQKHLRECILLDRASAYLRQNNPEPAGEILFALKRRETAIEPVLQGRIAVTRAEYFRVVNKLTEAKEEIGRAMAVLDTSGTERDNWLTSLIAGFVFLYAGEYGQADKYLQLAKTGFSQNMETEPLAKTYIGLGRIQLEQAKYEEAMQLYQTALGHANQAQLSINLMWKIYWGLGFISGKMGQQKQAVQYLEQAVQFAEQSKAAFKSDESKMQYSDNAAPVLDGLIAFYADLGRHNPGFYEECRFLIEATRGSSLREMQEQRQRGVLEVYEEGKIPPARRSGWKNPSRMAFSRAGQSWEAGKGQKKYIRIIYHLLEGQLVILLKLAGQPTIGKAIPLATENLFKDVQSLGTSFGLDRGRSGITIGMEAPARSFDLPHGAFIEGSEHERLLERLFSQLVEPIVAHLPPADQNHYLLIEPHRMLWAVPFASLRFPDGTYLCDKYPLAVTPSFGLNRAIREDARIADISGASALIIGNPDFSEFPFDLDGMTITFHPLPGAEAEASAIAGLFQEDRKRLLLRRDATEDAFMQEAESYNIIHLATHGFSHEEKPEKSFLVFSRTKKEDGLLQPNEILRLPLVADLVVLSACQTGLGKITGEGVAGTSRSFLIAGARSVLVSLWKVDDNATSELMQRFYRLYHNGQTKAEALRCAMLELKEQSQYAHPRYWAGFYLVGADQ
ncbi:MAG: CHAT domain-containing protein [Phaeodactylibacter sp.]|nr:CHAT domain-containing protein [Phaeodactylibacter sp.]